ncbi:50S ribosomal protein L5 [candidate division WS6 bacterium RIFOXYD1_FULL_33_8]|uniref:Large ribosomal subunit protein uL5 n=2 Tax=Candidatus Dojkabacteria TaxID=74243 RepID=A0A0G0DH46_9BACT|nr:ribosomal protein L5 [uncultured bacterium]KKP42859.1 MAG: 50S ribosomal protein L5, large subunit ribosomal protein L5 [candidate division WS6 bacterium GW2011_GWE2_33_157]KKP44555.1 MAG: 50S ribosomal protein L5, large subunit ribosomal protein L5 [candidate division WS6 bacterium GW2011_GWC1_33_20]KKP46135.1 MAG: 50S ribosomal protein L5, large subunit ribosomal protein L5 [candidate division WS6 bacterium GW2011_GWF1_33_233]KKP54652.1 MAG: 50S ribosomal protein L5 [candidate division WS6
MARLRDEYNNRIRKELMKEYGYKNIMEVPTLKKIVINVGAGASIAESEALEDIVQMVTLIAGQKPVVNKARKAVSAFKVREGMDIGVSVILRGNRMWEFFDKVINIVFPRTKDFRGLDVSAFDGSGNYSVGIEDQTVFPEIDANNIRKVRSLQFTIVTNAKDDKSGKALLDKFGFPFKKDVNRG